MQNNFHNNLQVLVMCVFVHRQASLNEAAERYYGKAADLRPDVSTFFSQMLNIFLFVVTLHNY